VDLRSQRRELQSKPAAPDLELRGSICGRIIEEAPDGAAERSPLGCEPVEKGLALLELGSQQVHRLAVGDQYPALRIHTYHARSDRCENRGGAPPGSFQCTLSRADVGGHALEGAEDRLELERRAARVRRHRLTLTQRTSRPAKLCHRTGKRTGGDARPSERSRYTGQGGEEKNQCQVELPGTK
jgi:hypothetical protein